MADDRLELAQQFSLAHPDKAAEVIGQQPREAGSDFLKALEQSAAVALLNAMPPAAVAAHLSGIPEADAGALIGEMAPHRAANVLRLLSRDLRQVALRDQSTVRRSQIQFYLRQERGVVGAWIESDIVTAQTSEPVENLKRKFSHYEGDISTAYLVDGSQKVVGSVNAASLVAADLDRPASSLMKPLPTVLRARMPIEAAVAERAWRQTDILPVAEAAGELLGVVRYVTLRHAVDDLAGEPISEMSGSAVMGLADAWFLGLSDLLSASMGRAKPDTGNTQMPMGEQS